jgi:NAD(P)-dependent dehydrogenase (short-subunit alcohol dehydrogenase family)
MSRLLEGRSALVTGGGAGIGRATALAMAREGALVAVADRDGEAAGRTVALINAAGGQAMSLAVDVTDAGQVARMVAAVAAAQGGLDCAFNNAGVAPHQVGSLGQRSAEWSEDAFDRMIDVNLKSVWLCMKHEILLMQARARSREAQAGGEHADRERAGGTLGAAIVNTASIAGLVGLPRSCGYVAAKHAVIGLTKTAALEYAPDGIRVNAVCPGFVTTRMTAIAREMRGEAILGRTPMGRYAEPEEIAELVVWLCSDRASYVTGAAYRVDGGWTAA